jgi:hypothetical protein
MEDLNHFSLLMLLSYVMQGLQYFEVAEDEVSYESN